MAPEAAFPGAEPGCGGEQEKKKALGWMCSGVRRRGEVGKGGGRRGGALTMLSESRRSALRADVCFFCVLIYRRASLTLWPKAVRERAERSEKRPEREIQPGVKGVGAKFKDVRGMWGLADIVGALEAPTRAT